MFEGYILYIFVFLFGVSIGSFLNVAIYRIPKSISYNEIEIAKEILGIIDKQGLETKKDKYSLLKPSKCIKCHKNIKYRHNIPIIGWFLLKGRCYFCGSKISLQYPFVELITAVIFTLIIYSFGFTLQSIFLLILTSFCVLLFFIDAKHKILPDILTLPLMWLGIIANYYTTFTALENSVLGAVFGYLSLWSIYWLYKIFTRKDGFGYGDFKLLAAIGAWFGYQMLLYTIFISSITGLIIGLFINVFIRKTDNIAFGPAIILATVFYLLTKDNIYLWYKHLFYVL